MLSTKQRLLEVALRLFGAQGYAATSVAQLEQAAGMSPGAGGLYSHFRSKEALLRAALESVLTPADELVATLQPGNGGPAPGDSTGSSPVTAQLEAMVRSGLARLDHDRDYNRILVRDLRAVPELLQMSADREIRPVHDQLAAFLSRPGFTLPPGVEPQALAAVLIGATTHFWLMTDIFGDHPAGVSEESYISALVHLATALLAPQQVSTPKETS